MTCGGRRRSEGSDNDSGLEHGPKESGCGAEKGKKREAASRFTEGERGRVQTRQKQQYQAGMWSGPRLLQYP